MLSRSPRTAAASLSAALSLVAGLAQASTRTEARTAEAVLAADRAWGEAEEKGDVGFVRDLLAQGYVSVGPQGKITSRAAILAGAGGSPEVFKARAAKVAAWKALHPGKPRGAVAMFGDTAVLTWLSEDPTSADPVHSCDVFVYRGGHWRAVYSQHTAAEG